MSKHTSGHWSLRQYGGGKLEVVATVDGHVRHVAWLGKDVSDADAKLIAQSPCLLSALQSLCYEIDQVYDVDDGTGNISGDIMVEFEKARAAIKAATDE